MNVGGSRYWSSRHCMLISGSHLDFFATCTGNVHVGSVFWTSTDIDDNVSAQGVLETDKAHRHAI